MRIWRHAKPWAKPRDGHVFVARLDGLEELFWARGGKFYRLSIPAWDAVGVSTEQIMAAYNTLHQLGEVDEWVMADQDPGSRTSTSDESLNTMV